MKKALPVLLVLVLVLGVFALSYPQISTAVSNLFVSDHSAEVFGGGLYWDGAEYIECEGEYTEGKTLATDADKSWEINAVEEDETHTFVVKRSFLDQYLCVRKSYTIPTSGTVTGVFWNGKKITDPAFCNAVSKIYSSEDETFLYETDGIYMLTETQKMRQIYLCYEDCPVGTSYIGYLGKAGGQWAMTVNISDNDNNVDTSQKAYTVTCKRIPEEYAPLLEKYLT